MRKIKKMSTKQVLLKIFYFDLSYANSKSFQRAFTIFSKLLTAAYIHRKYVVWSIENIQWNLLLKAFIQYFRKLSNKIYDFARNAFTDFIYWKYISQNIKKWSAFTKKILQTFYLELSSKSSISFHITFKKIV